MAQLREELFWTQEHFPVPLTFWWNSFQKRCLDHKDLSGESMDVVEINSLTDKPWAPTFFFNWSIVDLQCCVNFCCTAKWFSYTHTHTHTYQFSSVVQSCPTLCSPMDCSTPVSLSITNSRSLYIRILFYILFRYDLSQDTDYSSLGSTVGPCCLSILYTIICICQPQTPNLSLSQAHLLATLHPFSVSVSLFHW